jgi:DNA-binding protein Fis
LRSFNQTLLFNAATKVFNLPDLLAEVARHYLIRALEEAGQNKSKAAKLIGLSNYQTFDNWLGEYQ